ncbi:MAG: MBL fold metallo-hydrolase [Kangiellaceae bacterium]|nr:MBL fold metallo-hydrolase [Kangiellaceae bacterium]|tara:strand:- start:31 stop:912 length:882 start_codon:yes stop_codon:yes gene_type:complete
MKVKLRGVRGSIPVPGPDTVKYGGNTTCIEVVTDEGDVIIIDGGSGIRTLGLELLKQHPVKCTLLITHTHWDHIQGLPFFVPFFVPGNQIDIYGTFDPIYMKSLKSILAAQMEYCYFPVRECELNAKISYNDIREGQAIQVGSATITPILLNHPVLNYGYRIESHGKVFFFTGDYEHPVNIYEPEDDGYDDYQQLIEEQKGVLSDFIRGADLVVADSQYTVEEYKTKKGWGHGTHESSIELARDAEIKKMVFTHHEPVRTDKQLDEIYERLMRRSDLPDSELLMAVEGTEFIL